MEKNSLWNRIKIWVKNQIKGTKQIGNGNDTKVPISKGSSLNQYRAKSLSAMTNDEINSLLHLGYESYGKKEITEEVLVRIGATPELAKKIVNNKRTNAFFTPHIGNGKLVTTVDGQVIYEDNYKHRDVGDFLPIEERTTITCEEGAIVIKTTEGYDYFGQESLDRKPTYQVKMEENNRNGVTIQTLEKEPIQQQRLTSRVVFDEHHMEIEKERQMYLAGSDQIVTSKMWRDEVDPFRMNEVIEDSRGEKLLNRTDQIHPEYPECLYSCYIITSAQQEIDWGKLEQRNPQSARYLSSLKKEGKIQE